MVWMPTTILWLLPPVARGLRIGARPDSLEERLPAGVASCDLLRGLPCGLLCHQLCDDRLPVAGQPDL